MLNAQGIRLKFNEFKCYISSKMSDIACITEIWIRGVLWRRIGQRIGSIGLWLARAQYVSYCRESQQGGGALLYVKKP